MVVAVEAGVERMPALKTPVVDISRERKRRFPGRNYAFGKSAKPSAADKGCNDGGKEKPPPGDLH